MHGHYEAVVVGSGFAGAVTACRLAEAGIRTCILERGRRYDPSSDFPVLPLPDAPGVPGDSLDGTRDEVQPDVARLVWGGDGGLWELRDLGDVIVGQAAGYGGGSLIYANVHLRPPAHAFDHRWAIGLAELAEYYDLAAYMLKVSPLPAEHEDIPKAVQLKRAANDLNTEGQYLRQIAPPLAVNFDAHDPTARGTCDLAGNCVFGCPRGAKNTLDLNYLSRAEHHGVEVVTRAEVTLVHELPDGRLRVDYRDHLEGRTVKSLYADHVFLCAGSVNTTEILLRSRESHALWIDSTGLGSGFHPNVDAVAAIFDCDEPQELDRGPAITSALVYDREPPDDDSAARWRLGFSEATGEMKVDEEIFSESGGVARIVAMPRVSSGSFGDGDASGELVVSRLVGEFRVGSAIRTATGERCAFVLDQPRKVRHWLLVQDGGLPSAFEPALGFLRSPLWLRRNAFRERRPTRRTGSSMRWAGTPAQIPRRNDSGYAPLPFQEVAATLEAPPSIDGPLLPTQLDASLGRFRGRLSAEVRLMIGELLSSSLGETIKNAEVKVSNALETLGDSAAHEQTNIVEGTLRLAIHLLWGGQEGLAAAIADPLLSKLSPSGDRLPHDALAVLQRLLDYRFGDGRTALLVSLGLDSVGGTIWLQEDAPTGTQSPSPRARLVGRSSTESRLRATLPSANETPERQLQERILRDLASAWSGELRTDPIWPFLDRRITVHPQGGCPMGPPGRGVTDSEGSVHGVKGLYVMDAAAFPGPVGVNPSASIAAVAEYKVARFIERALGSQHVAVERMRQERSVAAEWVDRRGRAKLDPFGSSDEVVSTPLEPLHEPVGLSFEERMVGTIEGERGPLVAEAVLTIGVRDLADFLSQYDRDARVRMELLAGTVTVGETSFEVDPSLSFISVASNQTTGGEGRYIVRYEVATRAHGPNLRGIKTIHGAGESDLWTDAATLEVVLESGETQRTGVLRLPAAEFLNHQLPSFVVNTDDPTRQAWALASFGKFFFEVMVRPHLSSFDLVSQLATNVLRRGHV